MTAALVGLFPIPNSIMMGQCTVSRERLWTDQQNIRGSGLEKVSQTLLNLVHDSKERRVQVPQKG